LLGSGLRDYLPEHVIEQVSRAWGSSAVPLQLHPMEQHRSPKQLSVQLAMPLHTAFGTH